MKKKKIITALIVLGVLLTACLIIIGIQVREKEKRDKEILFKKQSDIERVMRDIGAEGNVVIQDDRVLIEDLELVEKDTIFRITYYNAKTESELTLEQVKEQFDVYTINYEFSDGDTDELEDFCAFVEEEGIPVVNETGEYNAYVREVSKALNIHTATREELEAACKEALEKLGY